MVVAVVAVAVVVEVQVAEIVAVIVQVVVVEGRVVIHYLLMASSVRDSVQWVRL
jgi:hypothetical protein